MPQTAFVCHTEGPYIIFEENISIQFGQQNHLCLQGELLQLFTYLMVCTLHFNFSENGKVKVLMTRSTDPINVT